MTFTQFLQQLNQNQVEIWWNTIAPKQAPEKVEEINIKYKLSKNGKSLPFKWTIAELAKYYHIDFKNIDFDSNQINRDAFCAAFDFEIEEELVYDDFEKNTFLSFYEKYVSNKELFQSLLNYANRILITHEINPYKIRMALSKKDKSARVIIGMRVVLDYREENGKPVISFILEEEVFNRFKDELKVNNIERFKGKHGEKLLVHLELSEWQEIPLEILKSNEEEFVRQYNAIKDTKRASWKTEANTTNSALKYLMFEGFNVKEWVSSNKTINYWVFQGNPKEFDIVNALKDEALKTWRVKAHKDKIKRGDKVILWCGGNNAGVYALATVDSEVTKMPEPEIEKYYYKDQNTYEDKERVFLKIDYNLFDNPVLKNDLEKEIWFSKMKVGMQGTNFSATKEEYDSIVNLVNKMNKLIINISWNSKDWKEESQDKSNHQWVKKGGIPFESWNFASDAEGNTDEHIYGYAKFTNNPRISGKSIFIFYSDKKIVGFYGNGAIVEKKVKDSVLNLRGDQNISFVLENKIEDIVEKGYLEDGKRIGQGGFNYLHKNETVVKILDDALHLNPNQKEEINRLKEWFMKETQINKIIEKINDSNDLKAPLNQILYGPPGTGKTYNTINKAISIVNPDFDLSQGRELIKAEYDRLVKVGQVVFTTFHQSMSYEDFIEGIKPKIDENDDEGKQVYYEVENGIFKRLVEHAKKVRTASSIQIEPYSFEDGWNDLVADANKHLEENNPLFLSIQTPNLGLKIVEVTERGNLNLKPVYSEASKEYTVSYTRTKKLQEAFPDLTVVRNIDKEFRAVMGGSNSTAYWAVLNYINQRINEKTKVISQDVVLPSLPYVLIIDEINRGNVSQIFGELITLIEDDKRLGKDEALEVTLPYSKEKFGVPSNLHIIGTMNTADRSVEALDTALRRRFSFEEMPSKPELIATEGKLKNSNGEINGINLVELLKIINKRIEKLIDKDHQIGHSYFISVASLEDLKHSFQNKIIPLLQEYFFGDYGKIGLVLGKDFFEEPITENSDLFASFYDYDGSEFEDRSIYHLKNIYKMQDADFINAIHTLLSGK